MTAGHLMVEDVAELLAAHAPSVVGNRKLYVVGILAGRDGDLAAPVCKLAGVVGQCVQHEEGQHAVGLDDSRRRLDA